jgi:hypothetical protein
MVGEFDRSRAHESAELLRTVRLELRSRRVAVPGRGWAPVQEAMAEALRDQPTDIAGVLARLKAVQAMLDQLPPTPALNRVAAFNSLYYTITDRVGRALTGPGVTDPAFLEMLDVEFAKRYLNALRLWGEDDEATPDSWEVLFRRGQDNRLSRLAGAMLGVNAHINFDLALALIATWRELGPPTGGVVHPDYLLINQIFYEEIPGLRRRYSTSWQLRLDALSGQLDDWSQRVLVASTRALAWEQAERIWPLCDDAEDYARAQLVMDRAAAYVGESLIVGDGFVARVGVVVTTVGRTLRGLVVRVVRVVRVRRRSRAGADPASR